MRKSVAVCFSLLLFAAPAAASDRNLKEDLGKIAAAYAQHFARKDAAGITSLFTKPYLRVAANGVVADNSKFYEDLFKAGFDNLDIKVNEIQSLSDSMALLTGETVVSGKNDKGEPLAVTVIWTSLDVRENGQWKIRMLTSAPKPPPPQPQQAAK